MGIHFQKRFRIIDLVSGILFILSSFIFAMGIISVSSGASIGSIIKAFLPAIALFLLFITFHLFAQEGISLLHLLKPERLPKQFWWIGLTLFFTFCPLIFIGSEIGFTYFLVSILVIAGLFLSVYLFLSRDDAYGIVPFFLIYPFLGFLEWSFPEISGDVHLGPLTLSPVIISIWLLFFIAFVGGTQNLRNDKASKRFIFYMLAWFGITSVSALQSVDPISSFRQCSINLFVLPIFALLFLIRLKTEAELKTIFYTLLLYIIIRIAIVYYFLFRSPEYAADPMLISLYGLSYILLSGGSIIVRVGLMGLPIAFSLFIIERNQKRKASLLLISLCLITLVLISQSRSVWLAMFLTVPIFW